MDPIQSVREAQQARKDRGERWVEDLHEVRPLSYPEKQVALKCGFIEKRGTGIHTTYHLTKNGFAFVERMRGAIAMNLHQEDGEIEVLSDWAQPFEDMDIRALPGSSDWSRLPHCSLEVEFDRKDDETPIEGTFAVKVGTLVCTPHLEEPPNSAIDAANPARVSWSANTERIVVMPTRLIGIVRWRIKVTFSRRLF